MNIGFIGVGVMGVPMSGRHLAQLGRKLLLRF
jgi:3-hydroxyisobutyrate dehydrogenase-like beta-hydroxyacid dehydrogenase